MISEGNSVGSRESRNTEVKFIFSEHTIYIWYSDYQITVEFSQKNFMIPFCYFDHNNIFIIGDIILGELKLGIEYHKRRFISRFL